MARSREHGRQVIPVLHHLAGIEHRDRVAELSHHGQVVGDVQQSGAELVSQVSEELQDLILDGHVERRGRLVTQDQLRLAGHSGGDHHSLSQAAGQLMRIGVDPTLRLRDTDRGHQPDRLGPRGLLGHPVMLQQAVVDLFADPHHRIQRDRRLLEDHRDPGAADLSLEGATRGQQIPALEENPATRDRYVLRQQAHDRAQGEALAGAGFTDQATCLALADAETDPIESQLLPVAEVDGEAEILHLQQRLPGVPRGGFGGLGECAHRLILNRWASPSPSIDNPRLARTTAAAGTRVRL